MLIQLVLRILKKTVYSVLHVSYLLDPLVNCVIGDVGHRLLGGLYIRPIEEESNPLKDLLGCLSNLTQEPGDGFGYLSDRAHDPFTYLLPNGDQKFFARNYKRFDFLHLLFQPAPCRLLVLVSDL